MAYRSDVALRIQVRTVEGLKEVERNFEDYISQVNGGVELLKYVDVKEVNERNKYITYLWCCQKWYDFYYDEVKQVYLWLKETEIDIEENTNEIIGYDFMVVGEDYTDVEQKTVGYLEDYLRLKREIII